MFLHAYNSYMDNAYPADELMPLSCKGRYRETQPSRGDIDDSLGNFSLTLIDTLDTLVVLGEIEEFERAVKLVVRDVTFDNDIVVSVFETNIRVLGGLLGAHSVAVHIQNQGSGMQWYKNELLDKALDIGYRLLPAFNTSTGIPFPRVNLRYGVKHDRSRTGSERDTCTACAGSMILEFSALSRLSGDPIFEEKASKAMEYLWKSRHRSSDLVGTVINIHNGDWVRRDSGVGAGIDSYYEYLLKAYILLGDDTYLHRFNKHYRAIKKYISQGPLLLDVHMHRPFTNTRNFMDALLAFWPGLQVLKGDLKSAIEIHEMLYQVIQRHNFLPEAFTSDFRVHWAHHPLRPEFVESTYFIYKATGDPHYLEVGRDVLENLDSHARVECGYAAIKDVTTNLLEDQMDSYLLAETFKYLYLLFSERENLLLDIDEFIFTTEAHLLPLSHSLQTHPNATNSSTEGSFQPATEWEYEEEDEDFERSCPNNHHTGSVKFAQNLREPLQNMVKDLCPTPKAQRKPRLRASQFMAGNQEQQQILTEMGIKIVTMRDGRVQLLHTATEAKNSEAAEEGMVFMQEMIELSKAQAQQVQHEPRVVQLLSAPYNANLVLSAGPAQFGSNLKNTNGLEGMLVKVDPYNGCSPISNALELQGKIGIVQRGDCMFIDKARNIESVGGIGGIVADNTADSTSESTPLFAMSGDGKDDVSIPMVFLFDQEAKVILQAIEEHPHLTVLLSYKSRHPDELNESKPEGIKPQKKVSSSPIDHIPTVLFDFFKLLRIEDLGLALQDVLSSETIQREAYSSKNKDLLVVYIDEETLEEKNLDLEARVNLLCNELVASLKKQTNFDRVVTDEEKYLQAVKHILTDMMNGWELKHHKESLSIVRDVGFKLELEKMVLSTGDGLAQEINEVLENYINRKLDEVVSEAEDTVAQSMPRSRKKSPDEMIEAMKEANRRSELNDKSFHGKYIPPHVKAAPASMKLKPGELFVDNTGEIYAGLHADEYIDRSRQELDSKGRVYYRVSKKADQARSYLDSDSVQGPAKQDLDSGASEQLDKSNKDEL